MNVSSLVSGSSAFSKPILYIWKFLVHVLLKPESKSHSAVSDSLRPHGLYSPWNSPGQNTGVVAIPSPGDLPNPGIKPMSLALQADSLPAEPQGKPKNTGVGSLSLLLQIFPTQEGRLYCRWIFHHLSYQGRILSTTLIACEISTIVQ